MSSGRRLVQENPSSFLVCIPFLRGKPCHREGGWFRKFRERKIRRHEPGFCVHAGVQSSITHICTCIYIHTYTYTCSWGVAPGLVLIRLYVYTFTHTLMQPRKPAQSSHTYTYIYIYTHIYTGTSPRQYIYVRPGVWGPRPYI